MFSVKMVVCTLPNPWRPIAAILWLILVISTIHCFKLWIYQITSAFWDPPWRKCKFGFHELSWLTFLYVNVSLVNWLKMIESVTIVFIRVKTLEWKIHVYMPLFLIYQMRLWKRLVWNLIVLVFWNSKIIYLVFQTN